MSDTIGAAEQERDAIRDAEPDATPIPILLAPDPALRRKARPVRPEDRDLVRGLLPGMFAAMYRAPGIGLAAPQVGRDLRFAIVDLHENDVRAPITLLNPEIVRASATLATREEGCLSLPGQYAEITRPETVRVRFQDLDGRTHELDADGLLATCLQHELDHLDGVLFVDHLSALKRNMILRRLAKEQRNKG
ncbi:MAG: peptide deformylase [Gluconacetobacter diazotrophicus]|nr:peptide deformylase [Gluconacetobacter diazotrophicus]